MTYVFSRTAALTFHHGASNSMAEGHNRDVNVQIHGVAFGASKRRLYIPRSTNLESVKTSRIWRRRNLRFLSSN
jgi:hypothetical protein